ncbi:MAG: AbrB/MazE/SpoVT family DNA-binding domain-containing protein [Blautia marasmi]
MGERETMPDLDNTMALAELYGVSLDNLVNYQAKKEGLQIPPKGKHVFGSVNVGERGQIVIPKKARDIFRIKPGDSLLILGDEEQGLAMVKTEVFMTLAKEILEKGGRFDEGYRDESFDKEI